jgi:hypothetical protein
VPRPPLPRRTETGRAFARPAGVGLRAFYAADAARLAPQSRSGNARAARAAASRAARALRAALPATYDAGSPHDRQHHVETWAAVGGTPDLHLVFVRLAFCNAPLVNKHP